MEKIIRHSWDKKKVTKRTFATCTVCGLVKEAHFPFGYIYFKPNIIEPFFSIPNCNPS